MTVTLMAVGAGISFAVPAQAEIRAEPAINGTSGDCPAGLHTNVPDRGEVERNGAKALFTSDELRDNPQAGNSVPPQMQKVLANDPTWLTTIDCGPKLDPANGQVTQTPSAQARAATGLMPIYSAVSPNWAGYRLMNVDYPLHQFINYVGGAWTVPSPYAPVGGLGQENASIWVGIGSGDNTTDQLLQAGTVSYSGPGVAGVGPSGTYGFFEMFPYQAEQMIQNFSVVGGDIASSYITFLAASNRMVWTLCTQSANACVSGWEQLNAPATTTQATQAEWIVERHGLGGLIQPLLEFDAPVDFYAAYGEMPGGPNPVEDDYVIGQGPTGTTADDVHLDQLRMYNCLGNDSETLATTGGLNIPTTGHFLVNWQAKGNICGAS
ncbi:hypothetical protein LLS1_04120 [Leifsonia sp. LS1]|nr:hypothetical protein LLS1_04120 [Leifsonia sp. LS1]